MRLRRLPLSFRDDFKPSPFMHYPDFFPFQGLIHQVEEMRGTQE